VVARNEKNIATRMTGTLKDISRIKKAEERLKLFAKSIENISDAVAIYNRSFAAVEVNKAYCEITGISKVKAIGKAFDFAQYPASYTDSVKKQIINNGRWHGEIENQRANGQIYLTDVNIDVIRDEDGQITHFVSVFSDITERKENEEELRKLANSDTLTGLPNRSYFQAKQSHLVNYKTPHALLVFDLDNFKKINDSLGHEVGDSLLCKVADRIVNTARSQDTICRLGGDEFSVIIENTNDIYTITSIAKKILRKIAEPLKLKNQEVVLYSSIGIVLYPEDGTSPQELLKNADTAMYHAKNSGGNRYQFFNDSMNKEAVKRLQVENLIRYGLKEDYFAVFYQPKIEIATGKISGMEALVRFEHPKKGIISPAVFIPVSEETGQIIGIGEVVLRKACFATKQWVDAGLFNGRVAVNLSAVQFTQPNLVELIASILQESQLPAKYLELEITEGTVMDSPQAAIDIMLQIRAMGIHLSLDDFGTGYSSLAYLKKFPLNTLKIDKAFVDDIEHSEQGRNMVATIVTIAHNLGLHVVAEGVEQNNQLDFLATLHCEQLQGFLYSKPLSVGDFKQYLISKRITDKSTTFTSF
jgi:diguanylate cyclase (GGDEF)-like protein/PAS domain S-box-containing protein